MSRKGFVNAARQTARLELTAGEQPIEMFSPKIIRATGIMALFFSCGMSARAQRVRGELRLEVHDPRGTALASDGELVSEANGFRRTFATGPDGRYVAQDLPFGVYRLSLQAEGFAPWSDLVEIRSEVPVRVALALGVAPVTTQVQVNDSATLVDPYATGSLYSIGRQSIEEHNAAQPGRELLDLVSEQPGWVYEANGVLHPRGAEYDVQFVVDGLPLTQNRSPAFAPSFDAGDVESLRVLTASFPAEYGRKLGGIARAIRYRRRKFFHAERFGGNFLRARSRPIFGAWRGISHGPLSRSSGAGELHEQGKCRGFLGFLRTGFLRKRPIARERDTQRRAFPRAERTGAAAGRAAAGYPEHGDERTDLFPAHDFAGIVSELFGKRAGCERDSGVKRVGHAGDRFAGSRLPRRVCACRPRGTPRTSRLENGS